MMNYSWFEQQNRFLMQALNKKQLAHAILLQGANGIGKYNFARNFSHTVLCDEEREGGCGQCKSCLLLNAETHPDFVSIHPEGKSQLIKIDQVRSAAEFLQQTPTQGKYKIIVIDQADSMNLAASNAILKTLEEPAGNALLILISDQPQNLLPTIRSRCQVMSCELPSKTASLQWLKKEGCEGEFETALELSHGSPLTAKKILEEEGVQTQVDILRQFYDYLQQKTSLTVLSEKWSKLNLAELFDLLMLLMSDVLKVKKGLDESAITLQSQQKAINAVGKSFDQASVIKFYQKLLVGKKEARMACNLNPQMVIEKVLC